MPSFQLLSCDVAIGGDLLNIVARSEFEPVTFPELLLLQRLHGEVAITEIRQCGETEERAQAIERQRLREIYSPKIVDEMFPGYNVQMPVRDDRFARRLPRKRMLPVPDAEPQADATSVPRPRSDAQINEDEGVDIELSPGPAQDIDHDEVDPVVFQGKAKRK
jgi:hypothetical protein